MPLLTDSGATQTTAPRRIGQRIARAAMVAALGLSLVTGPMVTDASRPLSVSLVGMSAVVTGSGDGVNVRATPSYDGEVLLELADGTAVTLRIDRVDTVLDADGATRWWPISAQGVDGWVTGYYLADASDTGAGLSEAAPVTTSELVAPAAAVVVASADPTGATAYVADPEGVNIRAEPSGDAAVVAQAAAGSVVVLRTDVSEIVYDADGTAWWPVDVNGQPGWVVGSYLTSGVDETAADVTPASTTGFTPGQRATVSTGTADGLNIRVDAMADADVVGYVRPGDVVQIMEGPVAWMGSATGWYLITNGGVTGYVDGDFLAPAEQLPTTDAPVATAPALQATTAPLTASGAAVGTTVALGLGDGDQVNIRATVGTDGALIAAVPDGTAATVLDGPFSDNQGAPWYYVVTDQGEGFVSATLIGGSAAAPAPTAAAPVATQAPAVTATAAVSSAPAVTSTAVTPAAAATRPAAPVAGVATGTFLFPVAGRISQNYGCTSLDFYPIDANLGCPFHNALDIAAPQDTPIIASDGGTVTFAGWCDCGLGYYVEIDHGNGYSTVYGHMASQPYVATGQAVSQGDVIGPIGSTGFSTGPHTHFEVLLNGATIDPKTVLSSLEFSS